MGAATCTGYGGRRQVPLSVVAISQGALSISVSVHGEVEQGQAKLRSSGEPIKRLFVTGALGGAAACLRQQQHLS